MRRRSLLRFAFTFAYLLLAGGLTPLWARSSGRAYVAYLGKLTGRSSTGIYAYRFYPAGARIEFLGLAAKTPDPSFLAVHPSQKFLYAVNESAGKDRAGSNTVTASRIDDRTAELKTLNTVSSGGRGPCHTAVSADGRVLVVTKLRQRKRGCIPDKGRRQPGKCSRCAAAPWLFVKSTTPERSARARRRHYSRQHQRFCGGPGTRQNFHLPSEFRCRIDRAWRPADSLSGSRPGVRHLALEAGGKFLYALSELDSTITVFRCSPDAVRQIQRISALPQGAPPQIGGSEIELDAKGAFLYTSIRGAQNMIAVFAVDRSNGRLTPVQHISTGGKTPRHFAIDPSRTFLFAANQDSNSIAIFSIAADGRLHPKPGLWNDIESPTCIVFVEPHHE